MHRARREKIHCAPDDNPSDALTKVFAMQASVCSKCGPVETRLVDGQMVCTRCFAVLHDWGAFEDEQPTAPRLNVPTRDDPNAPTRD